MAPRDSGTPNGLRIAAASAARPANMSASPSPVRNITLSGAIAMPRSAG